MPLIGPEGREQFKVAGRVGAIGLELAIGIAIGFFGGRWLDGKLGTAPWLMWIGLAVGLLAGARSIYRIARYTNLDKL